MPKLDATVLAFDYGTRHIGVAVGQLITRTAQPLDSISAKEPQIKWQKIAALVEIWHPEFFILGLPLDRQGLDQWITEETKIFAEELKQRFNKEVHLVDERYSTVEARSRIFSNKGYKGLTKDLIDSISAKIILESWLQQQD